VRYFEAASSCQEQIKSSLTVEKESFAHKCSKVLEELRSEAVSAIKQAEEKNNHTRNLRRQNIEILPTPPDIEHTSRDPKTFGNEVGPVPIEDNGVFGGGWNNEDFVSRASLILCFQLHPFP
jgi:hypothetical protein